MNWIYRKRMLAMAWYITKEYPKEITNAELFSMIREIDDRYNALCQHITYGNSPLIPFEAVDIYFAIDLMKKGPVGEDILDNLSGKEMDIMDEVIAERR